MAVEIGDLIRVTDFQTYLGETCLNVYYYRIIEDTPLGADYLEELAEGFLDNVLEPVTAIQGPTCIHTQREWRNLSNGVDFFVDSEAIPGEFDGDNAINSFTSLGFMLIRSDLLTRNGYKRFTGLSENQVSGNSYVGDAGLTNAIADGLANALIFSLTDVAIPVIVKRPIATPAGSYVYSAVSSATFRGIGTQNTRKPGRGI